MWRIYLLAVVFYIVLIGAVMAAAVRAADAPQATFPPQEREDQFQYAGQSLDVYNSFSAKLRETGVWLWRFEKDSTCIGDVRPYVVTALQNFGDATGIAFIEDNVSGNVIRQSCGPKLAAKCGATNINCLPDSYPYSVAIWLSSDLANYFSVTSVSIVLHEMLHATCTFNEQYRRTADGGFAASEDLTVMNVGPLSRHFWGSEETKRWWRTCGNGELDIFGSGRNASGFYLYGCRFEPTATRLSLLYDDGNGAYWSGIIKPIRADANGCMGLGQFEGLEAVPGRCYWLKQENAAGWKVSLNEVKVACL